MKLFAFTTLGLGLVLFGSHPVAAASGQGDLIPLRISVFNYSPISPNTIQSAEGEASRVLRDVGVRVIWLNCFKDTQGAETSSALHFDLRIVRSSRNLKASAVGISFFADDGQGCCADLFYEQSRNYGRKPMLRLP